MLFGPLPLILCKTQMALTSTVLWFGVVIIVMVTITRFMFICVWKSMRTMNDDLIVRIAVNQALLSSIVLGLHTYLHTYRSKVSWESFKV